ncbi:MAG: hypothetical protein ABIN74_07285, partial [Ferruginibacter sp.]
AGIIFSIFAQSNSMKKYLLLLFVLCSFFTKAQKVESIYANLYTDSLKKGTFNYINIDGKLSNGKYIPLDSNDLIFWSSVGKFSGNNLWIDRDITATRVDIKVSLRNNPAMVKEFTIYVKQRPDPELKSIDEIMNKSKSKKGK